MATHTLPGSTPPNFSNLSLSSMSNPIDLTSDDEGDTRPQNGSPYSEGRHAKRARMDYTPHELSGPSSFSPHPLRTQSSSTPPIADVSVFNRQSSPDALHKHGASNGSPMRYPNHSQPNLMSNAYRPPFAGPSTPSVFHAPRQLSIPPAGQSAPSFSAQPPPERNHHQVIDLTGSPSPPPQPRAQFQPPQQAGLPPEMPPKTPVCIGQLQVIALVMYSIPYLHDVTAVDWATVHLKYEHNAQKHEDQDTIQVRVPPGKAEGLATDCCAVVDQKTASCLGPMLGKGLIRLDAKVRKGSPNMPTLPMQMLVYTPKGNVNVVGNYLRARGLLLDHPSFPFDVNLSTRYQYFNPHNPPPGGHNRALLGTGGRFGVYNNHGSSRWSTPAVSGKSVEVQRSQVDELFKSLKNEDELLETEPPREISTALYSHQKKAITFLLEREREKPGRDGKFSSLWQPRVNPISRTTSWFHIVTQRESPSEPQESKGAILADDMGLGKTIACVSLIASTLDSAKSFASVAVKRPSPPPDCGPDPGLTASHFAGSVWGMPQPQENTAASAKSKAKQARVQDRLEADYIRNCRIRTRSRATLIVCPLSTVANWEDQFREHWRGEVIVVGGAGGCTTPAAGSSQQASILDYAIKDEPAEAKPPVAPAGRVREGRPIRIYIYHGNARRPDPAFLADFDAVITTFATLASEYSKQCRSIANAEGDEEGDDSSGGEGGVDYDEKGNQVLRLPKAKKLKRKKTNLNSLANEATSALQSIHWFRVVLDEAHSIKETSTVGSRASCDLIADRRLCLTGTPVQNKLDDIFALIKFLRLEPFDDKNVWTEFIGTPVKYGQPLGVARLQTIMKCITLRRTKESKTQDGQRILTLPPRRDELRYLKFDQQEQGIYDQFFTESKAEFNELSDKNEVMKNYVGILQKILRLRQICDHFELVDGKGLTATEQGMGIGGASYDDIVSTIAREGINLARAVAVFSILRESGTTQCVECGCELCAAQELSQVDGGTMDTELGSQGTAKRGRKPKGSGSRGPTRASSPVTPQAILTRCQHLFCIGCYRSCICPGWPNVGPETFRSCSACQTGLGPADAVEVKPDAAPPENPAKKKLIKREKRQKGQSLENFHPSTKVKALLGDLVQFSRANPHSANYDPSSIEVQMVDDQGNDLDDGVVKTVVFSQWTSMLDKVEDALEAAGIRYDRLDGTMKRDERSRAMDALKHDPGCEVLLVSLKAGGVGLNLTAAQRVYLMDPYWNPAVENQAVDRIHRLGQTRPVTTIKLIIENSIEARLLEVQRKKTALANMTLGQNFSKAEMLQRRMEELNQLFG